MDEKSRGHQIAELLNAFRVIPRLLIATYMGVFIYMSMWYIGLDEPSTEQTAFVTILTGVGTAWFGIYVNTGRKKE